MNKITLNNVIRTFKSEKDLIEWLEDRNWDCGSIEAFSEWLSDFYKDGNKINVDKEPYTYQECMGLI